MRSHKGGKMTGQLGGGISAGRALRLALVGVALVAISLAAAANAWGSGALSQSGGRSSCFNNRAKKTGCQLARGTRGAESIGISSDGRTVYVLSYSGSAVASFVRNPKTG